jgi:beta-glucosidase
MQVDRPTTDIGWPITPQGFEGLLVRLRDDYGAALPPIYITENGAAYSDGPTGEGQGVDDRRRVAYYDAHLRAVAGAMGCGVDVHGYFAWSLMDNFEWAWGYSQRFGLVHVDYETQVRTPKASALWFGDVCRTNQLP